MLSLRCCADFFIVVVSGGLLSSCQAQASHCGGSFLEKAEEPEIKFPKPSGSSKKQGSFRKTSISAVLTMPKPLTLWITINC